MMDDEHRDLIRQTLKDFLDDPESIGERKALFKLAITEWLNERLAEFGWFSFKALAVIVITAMAYLYAYFHGYRIP